MLGFHPHRPWNISTCVLLCCLVNFTDLSDASAGLHGALSLPALIKSTSDGNLIFQFLLGGLVIDADDNVAMQDQEMASMRQGRAFLTLLNDNIPKTITAMETLLEDLESQEMALSQSRFESLLFGTVYSAYKVKGHQGAEEQQAWTQLLGRLANVTFVELRRMNGGF
ncbi:protein FAM180A [Denticeps clupeoides]|uniref:protein FAM180A n=1 Tax=Denticeps clupeoides TaxID=299321 RepID=UPI0010A40CE5|nr:protein FAM180A-like [Denticeps clupeoides]